MSDFKKSIQWEQRYSTHKQWRTGGGGGGGGGAGRAPGGRGGGAGGGGPARGPPPKPPFGTPLRGQVETRVVVRPDLSGNVL
jgi:hypothetical protein